MGGVAPVTGSGTPSRILLWSLQFEWRRCAAPALETDDGFAAETAVAQLFEHLTYAIQFNHGADARSDRAVREPARELVQALRRRQWILVRSNIVRRDFAVGKPPLVCRV
jgi:hypothetical protein